MTEEEWLASDNLGAMLEALRGRAAERKLRLFACACVRECRAWLEARSRAAVEAAEAYADGAITEKELRRARQAARAAVDAATAPFGGSYSDPGYEPSVRIACAAETTTEVDPLPPEAVAQNNLIGPWDPRRVTWDLGEQLQPAVACQLLREVFGNPFRAVALDPAWRTPAVLGVARQAHDGRAFDLLPIVADALEDAGCRDPSLLAHLRGPGPHARGCWALDRILRGE
jgi:hypothetical protein